MTRLSITLSALVLSISLAPAAQAYAFEPQSDGLSQAAMESQTSAQIASTADACMIKVTPLLAEIIGLDPDWRENVAANGPTSLACAEE